MLCHSLSNDSIWYYTETRFPGGHARDLAECADRLNNVGRILPGINSGASSIWVPVLVMVAVGWNWRLAISGRTLLNRVDFAVFAVVYFRTEVPLLLGVVGAYRRWWAQGTPPAQPVGAQHDPA